ncbi:MAG: MFS transporter [Gammaproteobacteria bacterium]|nr:MFS transporter [Gammaproteobacteria bacterium]
MSSPAPLISSESLIAEVIDNGEISGQQLLVICLCMFLNMLDGFDITAMAIVGHAVSGELSLPPDLLGWIFSCALAGMMAGAMFLAPLADVIGRRSLIIISIALVAASILLTALATSFFEFLSLRFVSGLGAGAMLATQAALAAEYSPERVRSLSVAIVVAGYPAGALLTSVVAAWVMPEYGWRGMFWFGGGVTLTMGFVAWLLIPESLKFLIERRPPGALERVNRILSKLDRAPVESMPRIAPGAAKSQRGAIESMWQLLGKQHRILTLTLWLTFFLCFAALYFLMSWIPLLMQASGYSEADGRQSFFLFNLGGVIGIFIMGILSLRLKLTNVVFTLLVGASIGMAVFAAVPGRISLLLPIIFVIGLLQQGGFTGLYSVAAKAYPTELRSTGIGWAIGLGRFGAVVGPAAAGYLIDAGFDMSTNFYVFAIPMAIGGLIAYRLNIR